MWSTVSVSVISVILGDPIWCRVSHSGGARAVLGTRGKRMRGQSEYSDWPACQGQAGKTAGQPGRADGSSGMTASQGQESKHAAVGLGGSATKFHAMSRPGC